MFTGLRYACSKYRADIIHIPSVVALIEFSERFSYYGAGAVYTNFIQQPLPAGSKTGAGHGGQSGALGMGQQVATGLNTFNQFWYVHPLMFTPLSILTLHRVYVIPLFGTSAYHYETSYYHLRVC